MCGIAGFINRHSGTHISQAQEILNAMLDTLTRRGPDNTGTFFRGFTQQRAAPHIALGHTRLSIIDTTPAGNQPMANEQATAWMACNGEIYNFVPLRAQLASLGHAFKSQTDTEVIIHAWEEWGERCVTKLNGMFSFAIWDINQQTLFLARDRLGKKPLYYLHTKHDMLFASEPKAILRYPGYTKEIDMHSLHKYFLYEYVPAPHTMYKNMRCLEPGTSLTWKNGEIEIKTYWDISFNKSTIASSPRHLIDVLSSAITQRLHSDVPLGVFLSGGIDSSAILALLSKQLPGKKIKTFTIGFSEKSFDESVCARHISKHYATEHHEHIFNSSDMLTVLPEIFKYLDEPFADASIIPTYMLSKFAKQHVTVALGGDGGDELFAGYDTFPAHKLARVYNLLPSCVTNCILEPLIRRLPVSLHNMSFDFKMKQFIKGMRYADPAIRNQIWLGSFSPPEQNELLRDSAGIPEQKIFEDIHHSLQYCDSKDYINIITYLYFKFYLPNDILTKVDRASMACSLEVRAPLLDYRLIEYVLGLPSSQRLRGLTQKYIFKKSLKNIVPANILHRPKKGFGIPLGRWLRTDLSELAHDELAPDKLKRENIINPEYVQRLLKEHSGGIRDNRKQIWTLLCFELWYKNWMQAA